MKYIIKTIIIGSCYFILSGLFTWFDTFFPQDITTMSGAFSVGYTFGALAILVLIGATPIGTHLKGNNKIRQQRPEDEE